MAGALGGTSTTVTTGLPQQDNSMSMLLPLALMGGASGGSSALPYFAGAAGNYYGGGSPGMSGLFGAMGVAKMLKPYFKGSPTSSAPLSDSAAQSAYNSQAGAYFDGNGNLLPAATDTSAFGGTEPIQGALGSTPAASLSPATGMGSAGGLETSLPGDFSGMGGSEAAAGALPSPVADASLATASTAPAIAAPEAAAVTAPVGGDLAAAGIGSTAATLGEGALFTAGGEGAGDAAAAGAAGEGALAGAGAEAAGAGAAEAGGALAAEDLAPLLILAARGGRVPHLFSGGQPGQPSGPGVIGNQHSLNPMNGALPGPMGRVQGPGDGRSDSIDAKLSADEVVIPSDIISAIGNGSSKAGADVMNKWMLQVRQNYKKHLGALPPPVK